jgi:hypothetical protein
MIDSARVVQQAWYLRTHPFFPEVDAAGSPIDRRAVERALDPSSDPKVLPFYFDVYDWQNSPLIGGLSKKKGLERFPDPRDLQQYTTLLILVSGFRQTGCDSLVNLVLHKIARETDRQPLVVTVRLSARKKAESVREVARRFIDAVQNDPEPLTGRITKKEMLTRLRTTFSEVVKEKESQVDPDYSNLFLSLGDTYRLGSDRPVVVRVVEGGDHDTWVRLYNTAVDLSNFIIVTTGDPLFAKTCHGIMSAAAKNVAWIKAASLDFETALRYVRERVNAERVGAPPAGTDPEMLYPFTRGALAKLYEPGIGARVGESVVHPIGWLRRTLSRAIERRLDDLVERAPALVRSGQWPPADVVIDAELVADVREQLNQGR